MNESDNNEMYENDYSELSATNNNRRSITTIATLVVVAFAVLALGGYAGASLIKKLLHTEREETPLTTVRSVEEVPDNIGKIPETPPEPEPVAVDDTQVNDTPKDTPQETTQSVVVSEDNNQPKPPSLKDRRLAGGNMQTNPQNATQQAAAVSVRMLKNMDLTLIKGTKIPCVLENNIVSEQDGFTSCVVSHDIYSGNAKTLLIEKGSKVTGMYSGSVKNGNTRLQIIWDRIITPYDLAIDLNSPSTDRLGASGVTGKVDNRWGLRIGSALLVSLISDTMEVIADRNKKSTVFVDSETKDTSQDIAEKVLDKYINLPPIIYIEEGKTIQIYAQQDIDFSSVYRLKKTRFHF